MSLVKFWLGMRTIFLGWGVVMFAFASLSGAGWPMEPIYITGFYVALAAYVVWEWFGKTRAEMAVAPGGPGGVRYQGSSHAIALFVTGLVVGLLVTTLLSLFSLDALALSTMVVSAIGSGLLARLWTINCAPDWLAAG